MDAKIVKLRSTYVPFETQEFYWNCVELSQELVNFYRKNKGNKKNPANQSPNGTLTVKITVRRNALLLASLNRRELHSC